MDIETGAGNAPKAGENLAYFTIKLRELAPQMVVTQPVFGSPSSVPGANMFIAAGYKYVHQGYAAFDVIQDKAGIHPILQSQEANYLNVEKARKQVQEKLATALQNFHGMHET